MVGLISGLNVATGIEDVDEQLVGFVFDNGRQIGPQMDAPAGSSAMTGDACLFEDGPAPVNIAQFFEGRFILVDDLS